MFICVAVRGLRMPSGHRRLNDVPALDLYLLLSLWTKLESVSGRTLKHQQPRHQNILSVHQRSQSLQFQVCCHGYSNLSFVFLDWMQGDAVKGVWTSASSVCPKTAQEALPTAATRQVGGSTFLLRIKLHPTSQTFPYSTNKLPV